MTEQKRRRRLPEVYEDIVRRKRAHERDLLAKANVVGVGAGNKFVRGLDTGTPCITVLVAIKVPLDDLEEDDVVPPVLEGLPTDVVETGIPLPSQFQGRMRPAPGGISISRTTGFISIGTLGAGCLDEDDIDPERPRIPERYFLLSCNHVIANLNQAVKGDDIVQPALGDGGGAGDIVGRLHRWRDIQFANVNPDGTITGPPNSVDAAIARTELDDVSREIHWIGYPRSELPAGVVLGFGSPGTRVQKTGRTTEFTVGTIISVGNIIPVGPYPNGRFAIFTDVIMTTLMSAPGDSGAIACELDYNVAVGMVFASSSSATFLNPIEDIESELNVRIGPPWLGT